VSSQQTGPEFESNDEHIERKASLAARVKRAQALRGKDRPLEVWSQPAKNRWADEKSHDHLGADLRLPDKSPGPPDTGANREDDRHLQKKECREG